MYVDIISNKKNVPCSSPSFSLTSADPRLECLSHLPCKPQEARLLFTADLGDGVCKVEVGWNTRSGIQPACVASEQNIKERAACGG